MSSTNYMDMPAKSAPVLVFGSLISLLRWAIFVAILVILLPYAFDHVDNARSFSVVRSVYVAKDYVTREVGPTIRNTIPVRVAGKDRTDWVIVGGLMVLALLLGSMRYRVERASLRRQTRRQLDAFRAQMHLDENSKLSQDLEQRIENLSDKGEPDRQELLRIFAETKKKLDSLGREVAFLAIDVVDSTAMKENEDQAAVQYDFLEYRKLVDKILKARGVLKSAWTPDGTMACFPTVDNAVSAGKDVIHALGDFNRNVKLMNRDFEVRCGVNAGYVHFDEATPMESMSDRVIDIAGHMQKHARPGSVAVARKVIEPLRDADGFQPTEKVVDGYEVSQWVPGRRTV
jgi:class 3 adenylate cyclase